MSQYNRDRFEQRLSEAIIADLRVGGFNAFAIGKAIRDTASGFRAITNRDEFFRQNSQNAIEDLIRLRERYGINCHGKSLADDVKYNAVF